MFTETKYDPTMSYEENMSRINALKLSRKLVPFSLSGFTGDGIVKTNHKPSSSCPKCGKSVDAFSDKPDPERALSYHIRFCKKG